jgi:aldehyde:ferredoxin oxidoreductase
MPTANFRRTHFPAARNMNAPAYKRRYATKRAGCQGCHILCKKIGRDGDALTHIPEFETMSHFSALIENEELDVVARANALCNELAMDTISAGATLACYAEIENEKLPPERVLPLLEDIGHGRGIGRELGQGSYRYAESRGRVETSMSVKKQELAGYDPRGAYGMALAYATSTRGGCHLRAYPISHEILRKPVATNRFSFAGKARIIKIAEDANAVVDSLTACKFVFFASSLEEYAKAYTAVTGAEMTAQDLLQIGERIYYQERMMNARNGFAAADDDLPARFFTEPGSSGNAIDIPPIDRAAFLEARANYYRVRGLDEDGMPTAGKARELGLEW